MKRIIITTIMAVAIVFAGSAQDNKTCNKQCKKAQTECCMKNANCDKAACKKECDKADCKKKDCKKKVCKKCCKKDGKKCCKNKGNNKTKK